MFSGNFVFPRSWIIFYGPFSIDALPIIAATNTSKLSAVLNNTVLWLLPNLLINRVCGIFKYVCDLKATNFITWVFEEVFLATILLTRINLVIGELMLNFLKNLVCFARNLHVNDELSEIDINDPIYALDSTTIDLCLSLFP